MATGRVEHYIQAGTRDSTLRRYRQALEHFEVVWGGFLPASTESVAAYLADYAGELSSSTLRGRLAALAKWHERHGYPDPTKSVRVREVFRGIRAKHPQVERQAEPLQLTMLGHCVAWLEHCEQSSDRVERLRACRDRALILLGFWRAFRSDELCRLQVEHIQIQAERKLTVFVPRSKSDRENRGQHFSVPALKRLCPVQAYEQWLALSTLTEGPVFRALDRWGHLSAEGLHPNSVSRILRQALLHSGLPAERFSSHSLRRGFATWASDNQWSQKALMEYVGWRDGRSALRYIEPEMPFGELRR
ncbi:site-specific integrase [Pseudomonas sp. QE6]|uniref:site-specific integrase n=1 Tax=Pseudomonas sp. QE6 TaxID=3242491 RepID=UPI003528EF08